MSDVEDRLRDVLTRHAADAPGGTSMLAAIRRESSRRQRRRNLLAGTTALSVLAMTLTATVAARTWLDPPTAAPTAPSTLPTAATALAPGQPIVVSFPFTPVEDLERYGTPSVVLAAGLPALRHGLLDQRGVLTPITIEVTEGPAGSDSPPPDARGLPVRHTKGTVSDRVVASDVVERVLRWQEPEGRWIEIRAEGAVPDAALQQYAAGLAARPLTQRAPFDFDLVPETFTVDNANRALVTFCPPGRQQDEAFTGKVAVMLSEASAESPSGRAIQVRGRQGWVAASDEGITVQVRLDDRRFLVVQASAPVPLSEADLVRFAAGVRPTPAAQLSHG